jgi:hypothetical protein
MKPPRAGGEIDSWCTKCKLVLNHRIIAMVGPKPVRVECSTCGSHHNYRPRAPGEREASTSSGGGGSSGTTRASRVPSVTRAEQARRDREQSWEKAIAGRAMNDFRKYNVAAKWAEGDLVRHPKFGDGVVTRVLDAHKVEILFRDEPRTLAQGLAD